MFKSKKYFALFIFGIFSLSLAATAFAATGQSENSLTGFLRRLFNYPVKAVQKTGEMTGNTLQNTGEKVLAKTGENTSQVLQGHLDKTPAIAGDAAVGTLQTAGQTASETVQIPVKAAEEDKPKTS